MTLVDSFGQQEGKDPSIQAPSHCPHCSAHQEAINDWPVDFCFMWVLNVLAYQLGGKFMYVCALEDDMQGYVRTFVKAHLRRRSLDGRDTRERRIFDT